MGIDEPGKHGCAVQIVVFGDYQDEGTQKLDKIQYSEALADVASNVSAYAADDSQGVNLASLTKHLSGFGTDLGIDDCAHRSVLPDHLPSLAPSSSPHPGLSGGRDPGASPG